jgi:hypothetical protein
MIELVILACLATGECRDVSLLYDGRETSMMTCLVAGQTEIARWNTANPRWTVRGWKCRFAGVAERKA